MSNFTGEPTVESRYEFKGRVFNVRVDSVKLSKGTLGTREIVEHADCVCVVPVDEQRNVVMVRQYRKPVEQYLLEIPAGRVEQGEVSEEAVLRELQEETGYKADRLQHLSSFWTTPGFCTERMHAYVATGLRPGDPEHTLDDDEEIQVEKVPLDRITDMIRLGEITDAKSITSLVLLLYLYTDQGVGHAGA